MPTINKRKICTVHGFYDATLSYSCPLCKKSSDKRYNSTMRMADIKKIYNSKKWADVRLKVLIRDDYLCMECKKKGIETISRDVHHIVEVKDDPTKAYDLNNLTCLCRSCHLKAHRANVQN